MVRPNIIGRSLWKPMVKAMGFCWLISIGKPLEHQIHWFIYILEHQINIYIYIYIYIWISNKIIGTKPMGFWWLIHSADWDFGFSEARPSDSKGASASAVIGRCFAFLARSFLGYPENPFPGNPFFLFLFIIVIIITIVIIMVLLYYSIIVIICIYPVVRREGCGAMVVRGAKELLRVSQPHYCYYYRMLLLLRLWFNCAYGTYDNCIG
jgi:hypothetical protein